MDNQLAIENARATRVFGKGWHLDSEKRKIATHRSPLLFAAIYLQHHLRGPETNDQLTLSAVHLDWVNAAKAWIDKPSTEPAADRDAYVAPRSMGKSTWWFLILPMWAAAHGHVRFIAAFADSATQSEEHLRTFKNELERNELIRKDYATLCKPALRGRGQTSADNVNMYQAVSGFSFAARGIDSGNLGLKVGDTRPDLIILDDIEPTEAKYSSKLAAKRLTTLQDAILPLNVFARVVLVGTVTMPGSIVHQIVKWSRGEQDEHNDWVREDRWRGHHYLPIVTDDDGGEVSVWPEKWSLAFLLSIRGTRQYAKNYANDPMARDGDYWRSDTFVHGELAGVTRTLLSIDPAVTTKASSDETGLAVVGWSPSAKKVIVKRVAGVRVPPNELRALVLKWLVEDPSIGAVLVETNQGGDVWKSILNDIPVPIRTKHQTVKKEVRAAAVLDKYEKGLVLHATGLARLEEQMVAFPKGEHDDMVDAVGTGVAYFLLRKRKLAGASQSSYS